MVERPGPIGAQHELTDLADRFHACFNQNVAVHERAKELGIVHILQGAANKLTETESIAAQLGLTAHEGGLQPEPLEPATTD